MQVSTSPTTLQKMDFWEAVKTCMAKYATFSGRASRSEFWYFFLFQFILGIIARTIDFFSEIAFGPFGFGYLSLVCILLTIIPNVSAAVRRLHDTDRSGWWYWLLMVPLAGIIVIVWACMKGTYGNNRFGTDPLFLEPEAPFNQMAARGNTLTPGKQFPDPSKNYCSSCGYGMMPTFRLCPKCGGKTFQRGG